MVRPRRSRPKRRNRNAGPARGRRPAPPRPDAVQPLDGERFPNLAAHREMDRLEHVRASRRAGLTREQARRHADEHMLGSGE